MNHSFRLVFEAGVQSKLQPEDQIHSALRRVLSLDEASLAHLCSTHSLPLPAGTDQASALEYLTYLHKLGLDVRLESSASLQGEESHAPTRTQLNMLRAEALMHCYPENPPDQGRNDSDA